MRVKVCTACADAETDWPDVAAAADAAAVARGGEDEIERMNQRSMHIYYKVSRSSVPGLLSFLLFSDSLILLFRLRLLPNHNLNNAKLTFLT